MDTVEPQYVSSQVLLPGRLRMMQTLKYQTDVIDIKSILFHECLDIYVSIINAKHVSKVISINVQPDKIS